MPCVILILIIISLGFIPDLSAGEFFTTPLTSDFTSYLPWKEYNVVIIKDRNVIEKIHDTTDGFDYPVGTSTTNTQTLANLLVVFNADKDNRERVNTDYNSYVDTSIGIASAYLNLTAHLLGYKTGYCNCFNSIEVDELLGTINSKLIIGIGHSDKNRNRQEHHLNADYIYPSFDKNIEIKIIWLKL